MDLQYSHANAGPYYYIYRREAFRYSLPSELQMGKYFRCMNLWLACLLAEICHGNVLPPKQPCSITDATHLESEGNSCGFLAFTFTFRFLLGDSDGMLGDLVQPFTQKLVQPQEQIPVVVHKEQCVTVILES